MNIKDICKNIQKEEDAEKHVVVGEVKKYYHEGKNGGD